MFNSQLMEKNLNNNNISHSGKLNMLNVFLFYVYLCLYVHLEFVRHL